MWKLRHFSWLRGHLVGKVRTRITNKVDGWSARRWAWSHLTGAETSNPGLPRLRASGTSPWSRLFVNRPENPLSDQHQDHWFHIFITRCGTSSFRRLCRKRGDDTFKTLSGAWHSPKWLFWGSGVLFSFFLAYCINLLDFGFWTSIFKLPSSGKKIFQGWSTFLQNRSFLSTSSKLQVVRCFGTWRASFASLQEVPRGKGGWSELSLKPLPSITFLF